MNDDYKEKIVEIMGNMMSERGFNLWTGMDNILPNIWEKASSSTGKYHLKDGHRQPNLDEHVYDMLYVASKIYRMFGYKQKSPECDVLFLAIALHDSLKYGEKGNRPHTDQKHDRLAANMIQENKQIFLKLIDEDQYKILEDTVRYHSGPWSSDASKDFNFNDRHCFAFFVHTLDMLSSNDLIKLPS